MQECICLRMQARATLHFDGWAYNLGDFNVRVGKVTLRPREEFKGFMVEVEYTPVSTAQQATPALQACHSTSHPVHGFFLTLTPSVHAV